MNLESERPFISVHIPKTAGTSLRKFYVDLYGADRVYFHYEHRGGFYNASSEHILLKPSNVLYQMKYLLSSKS
jgi:hypothetical protein